MLNSNFPQEAENAVFSLHSSAADIDEYAEAVSGIFQNFAPLFCTITSRVCS